MSALVNAVASQSSTLEGGVASRAIDGNTDGNWANGSVTHTQFESNPWWQVDLGAVQSIPGIALYNRTDCCAERLSDYYVLVSDAPIESADLSAALAQPGVWSVHRVSQVGSPTCIGVNRTGRYVRVQLAGANYLSLAELRILPSGDVLDPEDGQPVESPPGGGDLVRGGDGAQ